MTHHPRDFMDKITEDDVIAAEQDVLACILAENETLNDCGLETVDFLDTLHQGLFSASQQLYSGHQRVHAVSLKPFVSRDPGNSSMTPAQYLARLQMSGADPATRRRYDVSLQVIKGMSLARQLEREAGNAMDLAKEGHSLLTLGDEIEQLEQRLKGLRSRFVETTSLTSPGDSYLAAFQASARRDGVTGVPIALKEIATVLSEPVFEAGNLYGLLSSSGEGKTSLTVQLILHALKEGHPVLFLSYDESSVQIIRRMIAMEHGIELRQQRDPMRLMTDGERDICVKFATWIDSLPFEVIRCQREGIDRLLIYARRFIKRKGIGKAPLVVLDHVGKVNPRDPKLSADRISGDITVEAKACADETGSAWLVLNQRNGKGDARDNPRPISADLYGGSGARADYDAILYLYSAEKYKAEKAKIAASDADWKKINRVFGSEIEGIRELGAIKVRFGDPTLTELVKFEPRYARYVTNRTVDPQERMF